MSYEKNIIQILEDKTISNEFKFKKILKIQKEYLKSILNGFKHIDDSVYGDIIRSQISVGLKNLEVSLTATEYWLDKNFPSENTEKQNLN